MIAFVWIAGTVVASPPLFGWKETGRDVTMECYLHQDPYYRIYAALVTFYLPLGVMLFVYARIFVVARAHTKRLCRPSRTVEKVNSVNHSGRSTTTSNEDGTWKRNSRLHVTAADDSTTSNDDNISYSSQKIVNNTAVRLKSDYCDDLSSSRCDEVCD